MFLHLLHFREGDPVLDGEDGAEAGVCFLQLFDDRVTQDVPGCRPHLLLLGAAHRDQLVEVAGELLLVLHTGLRPLQLLHHHEGGRHVSEGHHPIGHLTDGDGEGVDVAGLVVAQQVLLEDLRRQPGQV